MLYGVIITYDDFPHIRTTVESIEDKVDEIIAVDGRFRDFPGDNDYSTDGTLEYLYSVPKVRVVLATGLSEVEKRNVYLVGTEGDWYLHLDADEEWKGAVQLPDADMLIALMKVNASIHKRYPLMKRIRLFRHVRGLHYEKKHYWLHDEAGRTFALIDRPGNSYKAEMTTDVKMIHHERERSPERHEMKRRYYRGLYKREMRIKEYV